MNRIIRLAGLLLFMLVISLPDLLSQSAADAIVGTYYVKDDQSTEEIKIKIYKTTAGTYAGKNIWMKNPNFADGTPKTDIKNPDPSKRKTPATEILMLYDFKYDAEKKEWVGGQIYDPVHGKTYKCKMWFQDARTLKLRGYVGVPALGRTMVWEKL